MKPLATSFLNPRTQDWEAEITAPTSLQLQSFPLIPFLFDFQTLSFLILEPGQAYELLKKQNEAARMRREGPTGCVISMESLGTHEEASQKQEG